MSRVAIPITIIGNEFVLPRSRLQVVAPIAAAPVTEVFPVAPALPLAQPRQFTPPVEISKTSVEPIGAPLRFLNFLHRHSLVTFALLFLLVGSAATLVEANYRTAQIESTYKTATPARITTRPIAGLNMTVASDQLAAKLQTITSQPVTLTVGDQTTPVSSDTIKSWLQVTTNADKSESYIRVKAGAITASLNKLANTYVKAPINQVSVTHTDGTPSGIIVAGRNGAKLTDPGSLASQAQQVAKTVMDSKGMQFTTPLQTVPFQAATTADLGNKYLEVDLVNKRMYAHEGNQIVRTFLVSAGAPATPTPVGEFHIYAKYPVQDMRGYNPNGTKYFQPHVHWVNYFTGADAVHGNYWRPESYFGNTNSSHGCVGVPDDQAEWIYDWAPIGTTVITYTQKT